MRKVCQFLFFLFFFSRIFCVNAQIQVIREKQDSLITVKSTESIHQKDIKKGLLNNALEVDYLFSACQTDFHKVISLISLIHQHHLSFIGDSYKFNSAALHISHPEKLLD